MNVICLGLNHHTAPVEVRERFAVPESDLARALGCFREIERVEETVILSTCNRVEFYAAGRSLASGFHGLERFLQEHGGGFPGGMEPVYRYELPHASRHLFRVVCGLDSMVLGETEILGQVKRAYQSAASGGFTARALNKLFQRAFQVAKQVRTRTGINRGSVSVGSAAADLAGKIFGDLKSCRVLVLGAGETGERTARSLLGRGVRHMLVSNRSPDKASALAGDLGGEAVPFADWESRVRDLDILITSTSATVPLLDRARLAPLLAGRDERPLFVIDLAVPRDVDPSVNDLSNVFLYDIDSLQAIADRSLASRHAELENCEKIIDKHVAEYAQWLTRHAGELSPSPGALRVSQREGAS